MIVIIISFLWFVSLKKNQVLTGLRFRKPFSFKKKKKKDKSARSETNDAQS